MDFRTAIVIIVSIALKTVLMALWDGYKERKAREPKPMKLKKGVYVAWGPVEKIQAFMTVFVYVWAAWMASMILFLIGRAILQ